MEPMFGIINPKHWFGVISVAQQKSIGLIEFQRRFATEEACHDHLFRMKWPHGFKCPKCGHDQAYEIKTRRLPLYECAQCKRQTTVTVGTIFEKTKNMVLGDLLGGSR